MDAAQWFILYRVFDLNLPAGLTERDMALYIEKMKEEA
jgi:hypothetical protein